ncbi:uncharacterized protein LOC135471570 [Liolophura sinensis]|uniref:uncharacterized protein LOC135471570 n=1 Tax=Liolophura sinensis TaxID=3198878 RepID=UPI00315931B1
MKARPLANRACLQRSTAPTREMCVFWASTQIQRLKKTLVILFYVYMLSSVVLAVPRPSGPVVSEDMGRQVITFYNKPCIPVDPKLLHQRMGPAFDSERMAMDEESMKRSALKARSSDLTEEEEGNDVNDEDYNEEEDDDEGLVDETESQESVTYYSASDRRWARRYHRSSRVGGIAPRRLLQCQKQTKGAL